MELRKKFPYLELFWPVFSENAGQIRTRITSNTNTFQAVWSLNGIVVVFKGPYHNMRMHLGNALAVYDLYGLFLQSGHFSVLKVETFLSYFQLKNPLSRSLNASLEL